MTNFIQHTSGILSKPECDAVIDLFEINESRQEAGKIGGDGRVDPKGKIDTELYFSLKELMEDNRLNPVGRALKKCCEEYIKNYPFLTKISPWRVDTCIKIQKYKPNEAYFNVHCENDGGHRNRLIAFMIYLNNVTDKGQTYFPTQNISFTPKVGDILMWPTYWTHPHHGIPSPSQLKYIMTGWYVFDD